jgi:predicted lipoprotein with Yx(FWY)xxD motif
MSRTRLSLAAVVGIAAVLAVVIASSGGTTKARAHVASGAAVSIRQTSLGKILADGHGRTLYLFRGDRPNLSTLSPAGRAVWPPFTSSTKPAALSGARPAELGTVTGASSAAQVAYNGHPLYYYVGDQRPGQTLGQRLNQFGAHWYVLAPGGTAITSAARSSTPAAPSSSGSTYGY